MSELKKTSIVFYLSLVPSIILNAKQAKKIKQL